MEALKERLYNVKKPRWNRSLFLVEKLSETKFFDMKKLEKYREGIERCKQKLEMLNPTDNFIN